jgi:hypothetical protein
MSLTWKEWKEWTECETDEFDARMAACMDFPHVHEFITAFGDWLTYCRVKETSRHMDAPGREHRTYCEALRDIAAKLTEVKTRDERNFIHGGRSVSTSYGGTTRKFT